MTKKEPKASKAAKQQRRHPTGASAKTVRPARSKQMSQAEQALKQKLAGKFDFHLAWHQNCVFHLDLDEDGTDLYVFADGSVLDRIGKEHQVVPRGEVLPHLSITLVDAYEYSLKKGRALVLWIAGERFTGTPKEALGAILRVLDPPVQPPKTALGLIEQDTIAIQSERERTTAAISDAKMLRDAARRLLSSDALDVPSLNEVIGIICKEHETQHEQK